MILFLQANDTFFFRDGRPFTKGDQAEGYSIFPPMPSTILGALRTAYIAEQGDLSSFYAEEKEMAETIGTPKSLGSIRLKGVFLADRQLKIYSPIPLDLITKPQVIKEKNRLHALERTPDEPDFISNSPLTRHLRWNVSEDVESETNGRLWHFYLKDYLLGKQTSLKKFTHIDDFIRDEPKIGIQRDYQTSAAQEHMLYRINMSRFKSQFRNPNERKALSDLGLVVDYECDKALPAKGLLKLGGEGKSFTYKKSRHTPDPLPTDEDIEALKASIRSSGAFKLYFATPAIFDQGWLPKWINKKTCKAEYSSLSFELITASVGKPMAIGGWNMEKNVPKPTRQAVPAGSVYCFQIPDESCINALVKTFHYRNISDDKAAEGFGLCFVGVAEGDKS